MLAARLGQVRSFAEQLGLSEEWRSVEWETLGKHRCAQLSCLQQQSVSVSCCSGKNCGEGVTVVSFVTICYSASSPLACSVRLECVMGGQVSCFGLNSINITA